MDDQCASVPTVLDLLSYPFNSNEGVDVAATYGKVRGTPGLSKVQLRYGEPAWLVTRHEDARFVLGDDRFSRASADGRSTPGQADVPPNGAGLIGLDPPEHTRVRGVVAKSFSVHEVERRRPAVRALVGRLLDRMVENGPPSDLAEDFAVPVSLSVIADLLGIPEEHAHRIREWSDARLSTVGMSEVDVLAKSDRLRETVIGLVAERRAAPRDDLLTMLLGSELTEDEAIDLCMAMAVAGYEGPVNQIGKFAYFLMARPELWRRLREQPEKVPAAIDEMLRFIPLFVGAGTMPRYALADVEVGGSLVRAGDPVLVAIGGCNRDGERFPDAEEFRLDRDRTSHLAWGHGVHNCIGRPLALIEIQEALSGLLSRFPDLRAAGAVEWKKQVIRGVRHLPVTWEPRP